MNRLAFEKELLAVLQQADELPSPPAVAVEVLRLTEDEDCTLDELAEVLGRDPALAAKLLKLSNSSLFTLGTEVTTLQRATMVLGMKAVKLMSLSFSLVGTLPRAGRAGGFDFTAYWRHSLVNAAVARSLARLVGSNEGDEAFLCGLLTYFGKLVLARCFAARYEEVIATVGPWPSLEDETKGLGFHSADVGAALLREWGIPASVLAAVAFMHDPESAPPEDREQHGSLLRLMELAQLGEIVICDEEKGVALRRMHERGAAHFGLDEEQIDLFLLELAPRIDETADLLSVELPDKQTHEEIIDRARRQIVNIGLGTAGDLKVERRRNAVLETETKDLRERATMDALTGLPNRRAFDEALTHHVQARLERRVPRALGLVLLDIDHFKRFNDTYGHTVGDEVLRMVGDVLATQTREGDLPTRYGGEEFAIVIPHCTPSGLRGFCERLRATIEDRVLTVSGQDLSVTASFGAACVTTFERPEDGAALLELADRHLYKAKKRGRNRSEVFKLVQLPSR